MVLSPVIPLWRGVLGASAGGVRMYTDYVVAFAAALHANVN